MPEMWLGLNIPQGNCEKLIFMNQMIRAKAFTAVKR